MNLFSKCMMVCWFSAIKTIGIHVAHMYKSLFQLTNCDSRECCRWYSQNRVKNLTFFPRFFQITPPKHACPKRGLQNCFDPKNKLVSCSVSTQAEHRSHSLFTVYRVPPKRDCCWQHLKFNGILLLRTFFTNKNGHKILFKKNGVVSVNHFIGFVYW